VQSTSPATVPTNSLALAETDPLEKQQVVREVEKDLDRAQQEHERASEKTENRDVPLIGK
jgi:hypothetical protein